MTQAKSKPDMSTAQYIAALKRYGFTNAHLGYLHLPPPLNHIQVFAGNSGKRLRDRLAYVLAEWSRIEKMIDHPVPPPAVDSARRKANMG